jgi:phosphatidylserine/phosphatidylglycerophosphate/cardiolipin synthase-like enzyme
MSIELKVYDNGDHNVLVWFPEDGKSIPDCLGFAIERHYNGGPEPDYLHSFVGFSDGEKLPKENWKWPLQRYMWWDYYVKPGDKVRYRVVPVVGPDKDDLSLAAGLASNQTEEITVSSQSTPHMSAYFNKGVLASQWVSRVLDEEEKGQKRQTAATTLLQKTGDPLRNALAGLLRSEILKLLSDTEAAGGKIFAALYELEDDELQQALAGMGSSVNLILANGAFNSQKPDENHDVRAWLKTKTKVNVFDRMVSAGHFAHNKFVVFCDAHGKAQKVLTGSTNWTFRGLCAQVNNAVVIDDPDVADAFLQQWERLRTAGNGFPDELKNADSKLKQFTVDDLKVTTWFVPTVHAEDLDYARRLINQAQEGILFLFFNPGAFQDDPSHWTLLQNILNRHHEGNNPYYNPNLYIRGVVNQEIPKLTEDPQTAPPKEGHRPADGEIDPAAAVHPVALFSGGNSAPLRLSHDVLVPNSIKSRFHDWEDELLKIGVMVHSKVIVIDPFGANPVLMTGSHNLGFKASSKNDDNLVIIEGAGSLAAAYAANIIAVYQSYRWNNYVEMHRQDPKVWHGLQPTAKWQDSYLTGPDEEEIKFWLGEQPAHAAAAAAASASPAPSAGSHPKRPAHAASRTPKHPVKHAHASSKK